MANQFFNAARHDLSTGQLDWLTANVFAVPVVTGFSFDVNASDLSTITPHIASGATAQALSSAAVSSSGTVSADSVVFTGVSSGQTVIGIVLYADQGAGRFDPILYYDTGAGFPLTTTGADITVDWNATAVSGTLYSTN